MWKYFVNVNFPDVANCAEVMQEIVSILKKYTLMYLGIEKKPHDIYNLLSNGSEKKTSLSFYI